MNPNQWVNNMLNDPQNQIPHLQMLNSSSSSNPNTPSSANSVTSNTHQLPSFPNQFATFNSPFANFTPDQFILWQQLQLQQQLSQTQISQQQSQQRTLLGKCKYWNCKIKLVMSNKCVLVVVDEKFYNYHINLLFIHT